MGEPQRASAAAAVAAARRVAVDAALAAGDPTGAAVLAEQALAEDPYDEVVLRALMRAHLAAGRPASALAAYARSGSAWPRTWASRPPRRPRPCTPRLSLPPTGM